MATTTLPPAPAPVSGAARRLPVLPALDGLRALAVAAVLLYHADVEAVPGGFLGVEAFFVVSGYLITALLWTEAISTGRLDVPRFWLRRARRLLPALFASMAFATVGLVAFYPSMVARVRGDLVAAAAYVSNWYLVFTERSYFDTFERASPFEHLWSLAVEEQFYLAFPLLFGLLLFFLGRRPRRLACATGGLAAASSVWMWLLYEPREDPSRVYFGTDTRASGLLIGATVALLWRPWERDGRPVLTDPRMRALTGVAGWAGIVLLVHAALTLADRDPDVYRGGIQRVALATALVIVGTTGRSGALRWLLSGRVITAVGRRSYSLYLWHWPVYVVTRPGLDLPWSSGPVLVVRLVLTVALAELSYRVVERPIRDGELGRLRRRLRHVLATSAPVRRARLRRRWSTIGTATGLALALVAVLVVRAQPTVPDAALFSSQSSILATRPLVTPPEPGPQAVAVAAVVADLPAAPTTAPAAAPVVAAAPGPVPPPVVPSNLPPRRVYAIGDSVMLGSAEALGRVMPGIAVDAVVGRQLSEGIEVVKALAAQGALPDVLLVHLGNNGDVYASQFEALFAAAGATPVVLVTVKVERKWEAANNDVIRSFVGRPNLRLADWKNVVAGCPGAVFFRDGTHLRADGQACYAGLLAPLVLG